ncbi:hypothetical protein BCR43DRAFT_485215 [Syncephalastrum racemosum]|uniref:Uncharacterized protein n=1 Tax=Syncephalastrum racemosum TaxID=13706 RepID=A0A1X2HM63_SYNRA|nr:hypothetical protein BCR43DRAFT_485215 [Syncephalastrum racemosum]
MQRPIYTQRPADLIIVGSANSGKRTLASQLLECSDIYISVHTSEILPRDATLDRKDCIVYLADLTDSACWRSLETSLQYEVPRYMYEKTIVVFTNMNKIDQYAIFPDVLQERLQEYHDFPIFFADFEDEAVLKEVSHQVARFIRIAAQQHSEVTMTLLRTLEHHEVPVTTDYRSFESLSRLSAAADEE